MPNQPPNIPDEKDVQTQLANALAENKALLKQVNDLTASNTALTAEKKDITEKLAAKTKEFDDLSAKQKTTQAEVAAALASHGVTQPAQTENKTHELTREEAFKEYSNIKNPLEAGRYWNAHQKLLLGIE